ncbi:hypothetical protein ACTWPT_56425 [Nonomuraea sp. 3N208]|uniref:hypothetical protein n=1 Tax=Nonomuraea sp. 3N208 TaxID=3457421 RepID=UPI003FD094B1
MTAFAVRNRSTDSSTSRASSSETFPAIQPNSRPRSGLSASGWAMRSTSRRWDASPCGVLRWRGRAVEMSASNCTTRGPFSAIAWNSTLAFSAVSRSSDT